MRVTNVQSNRKKHKKTRSTRLALPPIKVLASRTQKETKHYDIPNLRPHAWLTGVLSANTVCEREECDECADKAQKHRKNTLHTARSATKFQPNQQTRHHSSKYTKPPIQSTAIFRREGLPEFIDNFDYGHLLRFQHFFDFLMKFLRFFPGKRTSNSYR